LKEIICVYSILGNEYVYLYMMFDSLILYLSSYLLYFERISYPPMAFWSPTSSWCRRAGSEHLIGVSSRGRLDAYPPFFAFILEF